MTAIFFGRLVDAGHDLLERGGRLLAQRRASSTRSVDSLIKCEKSPAASLERSASLRTSSATTAKPMPCSPARAASMAAFKSQQIRLAGDLGNHLDDFADLLGRLLDQLHRFDRLANGRPALLGQLAVPAATLCASVAPSLTSRCSASVLGSTRSSPRPRHSGFGPLRPALASFRQSPRAFGELRRTLDHLADDVA